ncbi:MAG: tRNA (guanosine(46)-N7)-methyltransferase TrmB [Synergistaceae bacterium]|jgi:tRNA (guanine-N7-)-methyltransferase|nr:tRNA (guanosine(46)-N7)-methyltransferase TrmB [Synergistaceae bacterium]
MKHAVIKTDYGVILPFRELKLPLDLHELSGGLPRAELEIGFGNGEFMVAGAMARPDTLFLGMEVSASCVMRCARRVGRLRTETPVAAGNSPGAGNPPGVLGNLKIACTDARFMMKEFFDDASLDRVTMNFPCPWPKKRHARRRVTAREFADELAAVLKVGGVFELVTDEEWYALDAQKILGQHEALSAAACETNPARPITTKYERKWLEMGKNIVRLNVTKTENFTVDRQTWGKECGTMHVKTGKPLPGGGLAFLLDASGTREDARWVFKKYYTISAEQKKHRTFLVETVSADDEFEQRYYLKVIERGNDVLVKLDGTARAYLTPAVRFSVEDLARRLAEEA